jgi:hypothetical protein
MRYVKRHGRFYKIDGDQKVEITIEEWKAGKDGDVDPLAELKAQATVYETFEEAVADHGEDEGDFVEED